VPSVEPFRLKAQAFPRARPPYGISLVPPGARGGRQAPLIASVKTRAAMSRLRGRPAGPAWMRSPHPTREAKMGRSLCPRQRSSRRCAGHPSGYGRDFLSHTGYRCDIESFEE
jgi:hypothetical protein